MTFASCIWQTIIPRIAWAADIYSTVHLHLQVYFSLKLIKQIDSKTAVVDLQRALVSALSADVPAKSNRATASHTTSQPKVEGAGETSTSSAAMKQQNGTVDVASSVPQNAEGKSTESLQACQQSPPKSNGNDVFSPPKAAAKAEQKRRFPSGRMGFCHIASTETSTSDKGWHLMLSLSPKNEFQRQQIQACQIFNMRVAKDSVWQWPVASQLASHDADLCGSCSSRTSEAA